VDHRSGPYLVLDAIQDDAPLALQYVVQLGGSSMKVFFRSVNVDGVCPGSNSLVHVADQPISESTSARFALRIGLVTD
jgi:hypothetical protein